MEFLSRLKGPRFSALMMAVALLLTTACGDAGALDRARELERQILVANPSATYADPGYLRVAESLEAVPASSEDYGEAQALLKSIQDARRVALGEAHGLAYEPDRLKGKSTADYAAKAKGGAPAQAQAKVVAQGAGAEPEVALGKAKAGESEVILYSTSWCGYCRKARSYFTRNQIPFVEKDIEKDPQAAREMRQKVGGRSGVPVIDIDGTIVRGYNLNAIKKALN